MESWAGSTFRELLHGFNPRGGMIRQQWKKCKSVQRKVLIL